MENVFDLVSEFYGQDEEWDNIIAQRTVEDYLRRKHWQGTEREELFQCWDDLCIFCIYLGHSDNLFESMSEASFIDCVGWCIRNVSDFSADPDNVTRFLRTIAEFYRHTGRKIRLSMPTAPERALERLVVEGKLHLLDNRGDFVGNSYCADAFSTPDLPAKMFLNIGDKAFELLRSMEIYFKADDFRADMERARFLYDRVYNLDTELEPYGSEEYFEYFWDYFLFDYHLLKNYKRPIEHFYDEFFARDISSEARVFRDIMQELLKAELVVFSVEYFQGNDYFTCRNLLTDELYTLGMALDENMNFKKALFIGHIFYNNTMVVNSMRGMPFSGSARKKLRKFLESVRVWGSVRPGKLQSWKEFTRDYAIALRYLFIVHASVDIPLKSLPVIACADYLPEKAEDEVSEILEYFMPPLHFSRRDIDLAKAMWADFKSAVVCEAFPATVWAAGIAASFIKVNDVYAFDIRRMMQFCESLPLGVVKEARDKIWTVLKLEKFDPRYINEEGMLFMLFS